MMMERANQKPGKVDRDTILEYFLFLYKTQLGASPDAATDIVPIEAAGWNEKLISYDLHVAYNDQRRTRRITVGPIGEGAGSKSECFFAIYDNKLVVKIPPVPITDFEKYIASIKKERSIVQRISPRECIVPATSVILRKIHKFKRDAEMTPDERESAYIELLKENPEMQAYLKINEGFVFFMDLARYLFLADALTVFHNSSKTMQSEMICDFKILDDFGKFEGRYGLKNTHLGMELKNIYADYESRVRKLITQSGASLSILLYRAQEWFFTHMAGNTVKPQGPDLSEAFVTQLNELLSEFMAEHREVIEDYRSMIRDFIQTTTFSKHKLHMEGIVANTLELLAWLKEKGVAIRDIKPDNLLVAGDPDKYPNFLATPESFNIGLIDMETAVYFNAEDWTTVEQPPLGGTPFYATPLHLFKNRTLATVYKDLARALYLQDWFAGAALIYASITGQYLFPQTAKKIVTATRLIQKAVKEKQPVTEILANVSHSFWPGARAEFTANMKKNAPKLQSIRVVLVESSQTMILEELEADKRRKDQIMKRLIARQTIFKNRQNREQLYLGDPDRIYRILTTFKTKDGVDGASLDMIETLRQLKIVMARSIAMQQAVRNNPSNISAYQVMKILFYIVHHFMYKEKWIYT
ncbi:MAG: serine/threonine-protein kinase [Thermodesulfobacteriota bacterium]|nr:serine/threonine-protein kinase [Thermodesulfobacteriota bacterium]